MQSWKLRGLAVLTAGLFIPTHAPAQTPPPPIALDPQPAVPKGVDVLGKGPVHEAYARPADDKPLPGPVVVKEPPPPVDELPPDQRPEGGQWIPGYWQWDDERGDYLWVSGFWRVPPPGRQWVPGQYQRVEGGFRWVPGLWVAVQTTDLTYLPPPPPSLEVGPATPAPQDDAFYIPGCWVYQETGYRWRTGFWTAYRPGWVWYPAQYYWTPAGYVYCEGYWDYPLERRGLLFAPVAFAPGVLRPGFVYTPSYVVSIDFLPSALFVRPGCGYYFGDYYAGRYGGLGFSFWAEYRFGRASYDPLFGYYRVAYRDRPWERDLRGLYHGRVRGDLPLPPPTLAAQLARPGGPAIVGGGPGLAPLAPLGPGAAPPGLGLTRVPPAEHAAAVRGAADLRALGDQRMTLERRLVDRGGPPRPNDTPRSLGLDLPGRPGLGGATTPRVGMPNISTPGSGLPTPGSGGPAITSPGGGLPRPGSSGPNISTPGLTGPGTSGPNISTPGGFTPPNLTGPGSSGPGGGLPTPGGSRPGGGQPSIGTPSGLPSFPGGGNPPGISGPGGSRPGGGQPSIGTPSGGLPSLPGGGTPPSISSPGGSRPGISTPPNISGPGGSRPGGGLPSLPGGPGGFSPPSLPGGGRPSLPSGPPRGGLNLQPPAMGGGPSAPRISAYPPNPGGPAPGGPRPPGRFR